MRSPAPPSGPTAASLEVTPPVPANEAERLAGLRSLCVLDAPADRALDMMVSMARQVFDVPIALVSLVDEDRQWFLARAGLEATQTPRSQSFCAYAIHMTEPTVVGDARLDPRFVNNPLVTGTPGIRFYAGAPLITRHGHRLGTFCIIDQEPRHDFAEAQGALLSEFAALATIRIEALRVRSYFDQLTSLRNRRCFLDDIADQQREAAQADPLATPHHDGITAVAFDICGPVYGRDLVKALGHAHFDGFLLAAKARLIGALPEHAQLYRIGATCFGLLLSRREGADAQVAAVLAAFQSSIDHEGIPHRPTVSVAVVQVGAQQAPGDVFRSLIMVTDDVRDRRMPIGEIDAVGDVRQQRAFRLLTALSPAMATPGELSLHYQPRVRLSDGCCVGVEALLRWQHPTLGAVGPNEFIPLAEKTALIGRLTDWVIAHALAQAAHWQRRGHSFSVGINVSATDLDRRDFVDNLSDQLRQAGADPRQIEIEFTESAMVRDPSTLQLRLEQLRSLGLQLAIDDFGTGYSNLTYLKRIPATTLKIDQAFIRALPTDSADRAIVPAMIGMAHSLGHRVVAEGIETAAAFACLRGWGCDEGQGYWMARPMTVAALEEWLASREPAPVPVAARSRARQ